MIPLLVALAGAAHGTVLPDALYDPVIYPPDVLPDDPITAGEVRTTDGGALVLRHTSVTAEVHAGLARVTVVQFFQNPYDEPVEATYLFPLPDLAAVDRMDLTVGDRTIDGIVMERGAARETYEQAKDDGYRAALLEQERDNLFTQSIAGICPGEAVRITLQYVQEVGYEDGLYDLAIPMTVGERFNPPWVTDADRIDTPYARTGRDVDITVFLDEGMPVETLFSDSHDLVVESEGEWGAVVELHPQDRVPNKDFALSWALAGERPRAALLAHRPREDRAGYVALTLEPQVLGDLFEPRPRELLFVVDASCSMQGEPYETARAAVLRALETMEPSDTFNLVRFSNAASSLFEQPRKATPTTVAAAADWLARFEGGGTQMEAGVVHSLGLPGDPERMRLVLLLTDGYVGDEEHIFRTVRRQLGGARLFSLGVGPSVNRYLLEGLAEMGRGDVIYQLPGTPLDETVATFHDRIAHPAMTDVTLDWGEVDVTEQYPKQVPDLWVGQPIRVVARYTGSGPATVVVRGRVGRETFAIPLRVDLPAREVGHDGVALLWARRRIRDIEWYPRGRSTERVREEVTATALEHHLVSRYTSLVAVDDVPCPCLEGTLLSVEVPNEPVLATTGLSGFGTSGFGAGGHGSGHGGGYGVHYGAGTGGIGSKLARSGSSRGQLGSGGFGMRGSGLGGGGTYGGGVAGSGSASPIVLGALDRSQIDRVVKRHVDPIRACYQAGLQQDPQLTGKVVVKFVVDGDGAVSSAEVKTSTLGSASVEDCVVRRFRRMRFPAPRGGGIVIVSYPFLFAPG